MRTSTPRAWPAIVGASVTAELERKTRSMYEHGRALAAERGILIADTKLEFGHAGGRVLLIDEVLTPDSSRFWPAADYTPGRTQEELRQATAARLSRRRTAGGPVERRRASPAAAARSRRGDERALSRRIPPADRRPARGGGGRSGPGMSFAREGYVFIAVAAVLAAAALATALARRSWPCGSWPSCSHCSRCGSRISFAIRSAWVTGAIGSSSAPADGRVVMITDVTEPMFFHGPARRISIFMNVFDVHVNRYPVSGRRPVHALQSGQVPQRGRRESQSRERAAVRGHRQTGDRTGVLVRQIAGLIARRIVTYSRGRRRGQSRATRMGIIRFGSRVDVFLPLNATVRVRGRPARRLPASPYWRNGRA